MSTQISLISSMATQHLVVELAAQYEQSTDTRVALACAGGVEVQRRIKADEPVDLVVLTAAAIDELIAAGKVLAGSRVDLVRSGVAVAVKAGVARPDVGSEEALRQAVADARTVGYSTGPSGVYLQKVFEGWGMAESLQDRLVQARPGVPVGQLIIDGQVELGFQQLSELIHLQGIEILGPLPDGLQLITVFSGGVATASKQPEAARELLAFMASPGTTEAKRQNGMDAA